MHPKDDELESGSADLFDRRQIRDYLTFVAGSIRRRRRLGASVLAAIVASAIAALVALPATFHVEARLLAQRNTVLAVRGDGPDASAPMRGAVETIRRRDNLVALIQATDLVRHWDAHRAPAQRMLDGILGLTRGEETEQDRIDAMVERLEKRLVAWTNDGTVSIAVDWPDARMACQLVDIAQQNFLEARYAQEITALTESLAILQGHAVGLRADVDDAVAALEKLRGDRQPPGDGAGAAPAARVPSAPAARRAAPPSPELAQIKIASDAKQRALDELEDFRRHRVSELQARLAEERATYTENHPTVIDLRQALTALSAPSPQVQALRAEIASLRADYERKSAEAGADPAAPRAPAPEASPAAAPPPLPGEILRLDQELREDRDPSMVYARGQLRDAMEKYAALRAQVQATQIDLETAQAAFKYRYSVLTPAKLPRKPVKPNTPLVLLAALVAALVAAVAVAVAADIRSGLLVERWQIERLLDRPILGEIEVPRLPRHGER
jgi:uncharacterized protein involved in exopolysaccharide biosynthesis